MNKILLVLLFLLASCSSLQPTSEFNFDKVNSFKPMVTSKNMILSHFGKPDKKEILPKSGKRIEALEYWSYKKGNETRLHVTFLDKILQSISYDINENDPEFSLKNLIGKIDGQFRIIKEPVRTPHSMPTRCYLVDDKKGISILIDAYNKTPHFVSFWNPVLNKNKKWFEDSTPEFCIGSQCSRVTDSKAWKHNHCTWLKEFTQAKP